MEEIVSLDTFQPFDGMIQMFPHHNFPYFNCDYNLLLTLAKYFKKDELPILNNVITIYKFDKQKMQARGYFKLQVLDLEEGDKILEEMGITVRRKSPEIDSLQDEIINSITNGNPISIFIDLFYQRGRDFYYNQKHGLHPVFVYGFNLTNDEIYTVDDIAEYRHYSLPFSEFKISCMSSEHIKMPNYFWEYVLESPADHDSLNDKKLAQTHINKFIENMCRYENEITESLNNILLLAENFEFVVTNETIIETLSSTIYRKCSEKYRLNALYKHNIDHINAKPILDSLLDQIINDWMVVRIYTNKAIMSQKFSKGILDKCMGILNKIYTNEVRFNTQFYLMLKAAQ
ncbi:hypothetical protein DFQ01_11517 [Paenibacillus cellulosilyticus]|uniref:Butirosin biosynthesis protein H-like n=1 Tax=Paenibacillus cellulosilyticus TaxID=375489 RepID=A0A2V2YQD6_9BACL|nr:hypothetical protein [Paenibacillus cellulosilyticus]PWV99301.1 hypothetical protein DFQ01_11517 [Paenibacillus cellulosilyticus]QKS45066.1 hypothetical protein HUB94_12060 [Paenibacillus cellulosilyticus]